MFLVYFALRIMRGIFKPRLLAEGEEQHEGEKGAGTLRGILPISRGAR